MSNQRFIEQARADYLGKPLRIARCVDSCGEEHVVIEMGLGASVHYLDWIGADLAPEPDELGDELPFTGLKWKAIKEQAS